MFSNQILKTAQQGQVYTSFCWNCPHSCSYCSTTVFILLTLPVGVVGSIYGIDTGLDQLSTEMFVVLQIGFMLLTLNYCINFFLYVLTGQKFRREISKMICNCQISNQLIRILNSHINHLLVGELDSLQFHLNYIGNYIVIKIDNN